MKVRNFTNRAGFHRVIGRFPSLKTKRQIWWESQLERDHLFHLDLSPWVHHIQEQPERIAYFSRGRLHKYVPDFRVTGAGPVEFHEVKPLEKLADEELLEKLACIREVIEGRGEIFKVVTEEQIRQQPRLDNLRLIHRFANSYVPMEMVFKARRLLENDTALPYRLIADRFLKAGILEEVIFHLIGLGLWQIDLDLPFCSSTLVFRARQESP
jgi:hypothetical protein